MVSITPTPPYTFLNCSLALENVTATFISPLFICLISLIPKSSLNQSFLLLSLPSCIISTLFQWMTPIGIVIMIVFTSFIHSLCIQSIPRLKLLKKQIANQQYDLERKDSNTSKTISSRSTWNGKTLPVALKMAHQNHPSLACLPIHSAEEIRHVTGYSAEYKHPLITILYVSLT